LGRHVQIGLLPAEPVVDLPRVIALELSVLGSHGMAAAEYPELVDLVVQGRLRPQDLVTNVIGLDEAPAAMEAMGSPSCLGGDDDHRPGAVTVGLPRHCAPPREVCT
jgi:threonine dehydrogenase-like Zn-dependent dehydrogenase